MQNWTPTPEGTIKEAMEKRMEERESFWLKTITTVCVVAIICEIIVIGYLLSKF